MKERPIHLYPHEVRAIRDGRQTQTRRIAKLTEAGRVKAPGSSRNWHVDDPEAWNACPYGVLGGRLWAREAWARDDEDGALFYRADVGSGNEADDWQRNINDGAPGYCWRSSIHMPRWVSRISLEIVAVRVERVQDISEADAMAEGIVRYDNGTFGLDSPGACMGPTAKIAYMRLWESLHGPGSWDANQLVWAVTFTVATS